jgi:hypothetical protein
MTVLWIIGLSVLALVWVLSIVDIFRRHYPVWTTVGCLALVVILPFVGSLIYWAARKPTREDAEQVYLAEADLRHDRARRPFDSTGIGP